MVTKEQAQRSNEFHANGCIQEIGPRGAIKDHIEKWRRSGATITWKTRPSEFKVPIKYGLRHSGYLTHDNAEHFHIPAECPILLAIEDEAAGPLANMNMEVL